MARVPAFQAGYAGSIPVTRSLRKYLKKMTDDQFAGILVSEDTKETARHVG
jgi:RecB family endonuclease NucS